MVQHVRKVTQRTFEKKQSKCKHANLRGSDLCVDILGEVVRLRAGMEVAYVCLCAYVCVLWSRDPISDLSLPSHCGAGHGVQLSAQLYSSLTLIVISTSNYFRVVEYNFKCVTLFLPVLPIYLGSVSTIS